MSARYFHDSAWGEWSAFYCSCGKHSFSETYIRYAGEAMCSRCNSEPVRFVRVQRRIRRPSWCEQNA